MPLSVCVCMPACVSVCSTHMCMCMNVYVCGDMGPRRKEQGMENSLEIVAVEKNIEKRVAWDSSLILM